MFECNYLKKTCYSPVLLHPLNRIHVIESLLKAEFCQRQLCLVVVLHLAE